MHPPAPMPSPVTVEAPRSPWVGRFFALVGVLMFLGGAALFVSLLRDGLAAPDAPVETDYAHLFETVERGATWVRVVDAIEPCSSAPFQPDPTSLVYAVVEGALCSPIALIESDVARPCSEIPHALVGVARLQATPTFQTSAGPTMPVLAPDVVILRPDEDPRLSLASLGLTLSFALMGLVLAWFYASSTRVGAARVLPPRSTRPSLPLLRRRPLALARTYRTRVALPASFLAICALLFASMAAAPLPAQGLGSLGLLDLGLLAFGALMTLAFLALLGATVRGAWRAKRGVERPREVWAEALSSSVVLAKGVDVGNRQLVYRDPARGGEVALSLGAHESPPWIVEGHVLLVMDDADGATFVVREDGGPFALSAQELALLAG